MHCAGCRWSTGVLVQTRIDTSQGDASTGLRAILVDPALHSNTFDVGVSLEAWRAPAGSLVVRRVAFRIGGTRVVGHTGIQALSVRTDLRVLTLAIRTAAHWNTSNLWISSESNWTVADRFVVPHIAPGICATVAGVHTVAVVACLILRAVVIALTSDHNNGLGTSHPRISEIAIWASTDRFVLLHPTEGVCGTRVGDGARVEALPVDTGRVRGALRIVGALGSQNRDNVGGDFQALNPRVTRVANGTGAA